MKKILLLLTVSITVLLTACTETPTERVIDCELYPTHIECIEDEPTDPDPVDPVDPDPIALDSFIDIFYMNDFHGAILPDSDSIGFAGIANFILNQRETYPDNTLVLAGGDMLQGSALSNYYNGLSTINIMNEIGFDGFALGNHEFDWGLDVVTQYFDGIEENGEADFPLLAANVFLKGTTTLPDNVDPYTIIEKAGLKIGIIGSIGYGLEYSIATSKIEDYEFAYPTPIIEQYAIELRTTKDVDIVIWVGHDTGNINEELAALTGDAKIDALFNGHSHSDYQNTFLGIPVMQSGSNGENVGHVRINLEEGAITSYEIDNLSKYESAYFMTEHSSVQNLIDTYLLETDSLFNSPIIETSGRYTQSDLSSWIAKLMRESTGSDIAFQNYGGTRTDIKDGTTITLGVLYEIWPFDNVIKTVDLNGQTVRALLAAGGLASDTEVTEFLDDVMYKVATNDYTFDKETNPFIDGDNIENTGIILRDLAEDEMILQSSVFTSFDVTNDIQTVDLTE